MGNCEVLRSPIRWSVGEMVTPLGSFWSSEKNIPLSQMEAQTKIEFESTEGRQGMTIHCLPEVLDIKLLSTAEILGENSQKTGMTEEEGNWARSYKTTLWSVR